MCNKKDEVKPAAALTPRLANGSRGGHLVCPGEAAPVEQTGSLDLPCFMLRRAHLGRRGGGSRLCKLCDPIQSQPHEGPTLERLIVLLRARRTLPAYPRGLERYVIA